MLILTARNRWSEMMAGFTAGTDDYITKLFELEEVVYRVRALIRRATGHARPELARGSVRLDTNTGRVAVNGNAVQL